MARLADELLRHVSPPSWVDPRSREASSLIAIAEKTRINILYDPRIDISNVARYAWESQEKLSTTDKEQFPCLAPPFPSFWMEYKRPPFFVHERDDLEQDHTAAQWKHLRLSGNWVKAPTAGWPIERYGVYFESIDLAKGQVPTDMRFHSVDATTGRSHVETLVKRLNPRWILQGQLYVMHRTKKAQGPVAFWIGALDEHGVLIEDANTGLPQAHMLSHQERFEWSSMFTTTFQPALRAIAYMHCKNVQADDVTPAPKLSKRWNKKHGRPLLAYRTLVIEPVAQAIARAQGKPTGVERSHHFVRGHMADYRHGPGMFGNPKLRGIYYRPVQTRGSKQVGEIVGDYEVHPPASAAP